MIKKTFYFLCLTLPLFTKAVEVEKWSGGTIYHAQDLMKERSGAAVSYYNDSGTKVRLLNHAELAKIEVNCPKSMEYIKLHMYKGSFPAKYHKKLADVEVIYAGNAYDIEGLVNIDDQGFPTLSIYSKGSKGSVGSATAKSFITLYSLFDKGFVDELLIITDQKTTKFKLGGMSKVSNIYESKCKKHQSE